MQLVLQSADPAERFFAQVEEEIRQKNLVRFASEAAALMNFRDIDELEDAVKRAYNIFTTLHLPVNENFKRVYVCSVNGISCDWKLSPLAFHIVCLNGDSCNANVAQFQLKLIKNDYQKSQ